MQDEAVALLAEALNVTSDGVPLDAKLGDPDAWDSLAHARLIVLLEQHLGRSLASEEVLQVTDIASIQSLLSAQ